MSATEAPTLTLAPVRAADRDLVRHLVKATGVFRASEVAIALEVFDGAAQQPGVDYHGLGAYDADQLVGFTLYGQIPGTEATWDLYWIAVSPSVHRHGVGRRLMAATETLIAEHAGRLVVVETSSRPDYDPTRSFYEHLGYERAAVIPDYYARNDGLVVYTKQLILSSLSSGG